METRVYWNMVKTFLETVLSINNIVCNQESVACGG